MARKNKNKRNRYRSRYQLGGIPTNLNTSDTTNVTPPQVLNPIQRGQQSGLLSNPQNMMNLMQQNKARLNAKTNAANLNQQQALLRAQQLQEQRNSAAPPPLAPLAPRGPRMFQGGGMYTDNTVQNAAQGAGVTANIVYQENDPRLQQQRLAELQAERERLQEKGQETSQEIKEQQQLDEAAVQAADNQTNQGFTSGLSTVKTGLNVSCVCPAPPAAYHWLEPLQ